MSSSVFQTLGKDHCEGLRDTACDAMRDGRILGCMEEYSEGWRDLVWDGGFVG